MLPWMLATVCALLLTGPSQETPQSETKAASTQPVTQPTEGSTTLRKPAQAEILKNLLGRDERPTPIRPQQPATQPGPRGTPSAGVAADGRPLLLEGTFLVERPGRLVHEDGHAKLVLNPEAGGKGPRTIEILPNQLLEAMEHEAGAGFTDFIVSAEVTRYKGTNYLILRKILRRVGHGNLSP